MKYLFSLLATILLLSCNPDQNTVAQKESGGETTRKTSDYETLDDFGGAIFKLIQANNYSKILELVPEKEECNKMINNSSLSTSQKERAIERMEDELKNGIESLKSSYDLTREMAEKSGIDWSKCKLEFIDFEHKKEHRMETSNIYLNFSFKGVNYKIKLSNCIKIGETWLLGDRITWQDNSDYNY